MSGLPGDGTDGVDLGSGFARRITLLGSGFRVFKNCTSFPGFSLLSAFSSRYELSATV